MVDWSSTMQQTFEYYEVDPGTWKDVRLIDTVRSCTITRDSEAETLGSATFNVTESLGECYIRVYLITIQNGIREKHPLGTFLVQTPSFSFNGRVQAMTVDAYTPLLELKETPPPLGYSILKNVNVMDTAYRVVRENVRAPVVKAECSTPLSMDFVSDTNDTWLTFMSDFIANAKYKFDLDEIGRILFSPEQDTASLQPIWDYNDDNSSILYPDISVDRDLYGIPNVVEVIYSNASTKYYWRAVNDDPDSPVSTVRRGREIVHRVTNPDLFGDPTDHQLEDYTRQLLRELSALEYTVSYTHGYCPVRLGDCVRLNYKRAGITDIKAKVISQSITCEPGCPVTEKAVFTAKLWDDNANKQQKQKVSTIRFRVTDYSQYPTIDTYNYETASGMTWREFIDSPYNTNGDFTLGYSTSDGIDEPDAISFKPGTATTAAAVRNSDNTYYIRGKDPVRAYGNYQAQIMINLGL